MTSTNQLWSQIEQAGGIDKYVQNELETKGFLVKRRLTDNMSKKELTKYKKSLKTEALEKKKVKATAWQAYKQEHIVYLGDNIYWNDKDDWDKWDHQDAEKRCLENDLPSLRSPKDLAEAMDLSISDLRWFCFHRQAATHSHYKRFSIEKRSGEPRDIWAPKPMLKQAQQWIHQQVLEKLPVHGSAHGFLPGRSILTNAAVHQGASLIIKFDLQDFFPSIGWRRVKGVFRKAGYREQVATLLALICTESPRKELSFQDKKYFIALSERCLPQGAPTSPSLTNTLCLNLDRRLEGFASKLTANYSRYADDLTFSFDPATLKKLDQQQLIKQLMGTVSKICSEEGFTIKKEKTKVIGQGIQQQVTGLIINNLDTKTKDPKNSLGPRVPRKLKRQLRAAIHNLKQGKELPEGESMNRLKGYAAYIYMSEPKLGGELLSELKSFE